MTTMKEVAAAAGVSLGTVSNVLNHHPSVTEENRRKVQEAVQRLKYRPNVAARTLKTKTSKSLGLIIPDITNPFYPELARGAEDAAKQFGYSLFLCNNDRSAEKEREYINILVEKKVDGIILVKPGIGAEEILDIRGQCAAVLVDVHGAELPECDIINVDDRGGALKAMELLYGLGHRRIALISGELEAMSSRTRQQAYLEFLGSHGIPVDDRLVKRGSYDWHSGYKCAVELLRNPDPPTAIFAANDLMALGAMKAVRERQLSVPGDFSLVGFDDVDMASLCAPPLTTVRQPKYEIGVLGVETLIRQIAAAEKKEAHQPGTVVLDTELILRESTGYARQSSG
ncbi:MAG: transcriptional regulator, LacI family [Paenibacillaceae bacterium]|nr:transcriptional regulator, LacI family [Paenibacillaceae bacterium]